MLATLCTGWHSLIPIHLLIAWFRYEAKVNMKKYIDVRQQPYKIIFIIE